VHIKGQTKRLAEMKQLKFKIIKSKAQYDKYCDILEGLMVLENKNVQDEIELLTLLIEKWDSENNSLVDLSPIEILRALMIDHNLKSKNLVEILSLSKGTVSKILNSQKGLSKETIRKLSDYFKVSQEAFNRPYKLTGEVNKHFRHASLMNTRKDMSSAITAR